MKKSGAVIVYNYNCQSGSNNDDALPSSGPLVWPVTLSDEKMKDFLSFIVNSPEDFKHLRRNECEEKYLLFLEICLFHFIPSSKWKKNGLNHKVSELFSISDEAMAMVLLENNASDMLKYLEQDSEIE